jgi:hypothetical protein
MYLIQILLPAPRGSDLEADAPVVDTRRELVERFGGLTAYLRTPAQGVWTSPAGGREHDDI